jgi:dienelactone hydrolase
VDTVKYARALSKVDPSRIGMLGFSLGGYLCLRTRAAANPKALVEYFAPVFDGIGAKGSVPHVQIHHGTLDEFPTAFTNAGQIEGILKLEGSDVTVFPYKDAKHGFAGKDLANTSAAALSKTRTVTFFGTCLRHDRRGDRSPIQVESGPDALAFSSPCKRQRLRGQGVGTELLITDTLNSERALSGYQGNF